MKIKLFIITILSSLLWHNASAQYLEIGGFGGASNFIGDVGNYEIHIPRGYAVGAFARYNFDRRWAVKAQVNYGYIANADSLSRVPLRENRNLSFYSNILEGTLTAEFNFLPYEVGTKFNHTPYILGGFGIFRFDPKAKYQGEEYSLNELGTEGQGTPATTMAPYATSSSFFIFGMGYRFSIGRFTSIGIESSFRSTRTDYLDDVSGLYANPDIISQTHGPVAAALSDRSIIPSNKENMERGDPQTKDWYVFTGLTIQFRFDELYEKCASFVGR